MQKLINTTYVDRINVTDPDTGLKVEVEIRKLETGEMIGLDGAYLSQLDGDPELNFPLNPYIDNNAPDGDEIAGLLIPDDELPATNMVK